MPDPTIAGLLRDVEAAQEHLLIHHANMDSGHLVGDVRTDEKSYVLRDSFRSPCTSPHDCWNHLEAAVRALAEGTLELSIAACRRAVPRAHTYASENADIYRAADSARDRSIKAIRALQPERADGEVKDD